MNTHSIILSHKDIHLILALHAQREFISHLDEGRHQELMRLVGQAGEGASQKCLVNSPSVSLYDAVTVNDFSAPPSNTMVCRIVLPHEADLDAGLYSVLAPISIALLGRPLGATVNFDAPGGSRQLRILSIQKGEPAV
jgi:transcription elongation factor GreA